jgi:pimeloyl-ACP methyl ester carboxylesterase
MTPHIEFDRTGSGSPIIIVLGAFNTRDTGAPLAAALATAHTVINYDRRGRGESGDSAPYAVEREIDDLDHLIREAGGQAGVVGFSSGAALALAAAARGSAITRPPRKAVRSCSRKRPTISCPTGSRHRCARSSDERGASAETAAT